MPLLPGEIYSYVMDAEFYADLDDTSVDTRKVECKDLTPQHDENNSDVQAESNISMSMEICGRSSANICSNALKRLYKT